MGFRRAALALMGLLAVLGIGYGLLLFASNSRPPETAHVFFRTPARNVAHRGGRKLAPEATLAAFRAASAAGADVLEMDVRRTADGALVVIHDALVDRTTDGSGPVASLRLDELRRLNAGHHFRTPERGVPLPRGAPPGAYLRGGSGGPSGPPFRRRNEDARYRGTAMRRNPGRGTGTPDPGGCFRPRIARAFPRGVSRSGDRARVSGKSLPSSLSPMEAWPVSMTALRMHSWSAKPAGRCGWSHPASCAPPGGRGFPCSSGR